MSLPKLPSLKDEIKKELNKESRKTNSKVNLPNLEDIAIPENNNANVKNSIGGSLSELPSLPSLNIDESDELYKPDELYKNTEHINPIKNNNNIHENNSDEHQNEKQDEYDTEEIADEYDTKDIVDEYDAEEIEKAEDENDFSKVEENEDLEYINDIDNQDFDIEDDEDFNNDESFEQEDINENFDEDNYSLIPIIDTENLEKDSESFFPDTSNENEEEPRKKIDKKKKNNKNNKDFKELNDEAVKEIFNNIKDKLFKGGLSKPRKPKKRREESKINNHNKGNTKDKMGLKAFLTNKITIILFTVIILIGLGLLLLNMIGGQHKPLEELTIEISQDDIMTELGSFSYNGESMEFTIVNKGDLSADFFMDVVLKANTSLFKSKEFSCQSDIITLEPGGEARETLTCEGFEKDLEYKIDVELIEIK